MYSVDIPITVPIDEDGEEMEITVEVSYEEIREQPDIGINKDYAEVLDWTLPEKWANNEFVEAFMYDNKTREYLEEELQRRVM